MSGNATATKIDLHCHTTMSDGELTPAELVLRASVMQVDVLAITDHDSVAGWAAACAAQAKVAPRMKLIPGVEISTRWHGFEIHILGWNFDPEHPELTALLARQQACRKERAEAIREKLIKQGIGSDDLLLVAIDSAAVLTRLHFAEALERHGYVSDVQQAFDRYLGKGQCAYVAPNWCSIEEAVTAIRAAGGSSSIAHPLAYDLSNKWLRKLVIEFKANGGDALEVSMSQQGPAQRQWLTELTTDYELLGSVGSDFHKPSRFRELGRNLNLPENVQPVWYDWANMQ